jgi:hypothetical protein
MVRIQACTRKEILVKYITAIYINRAILDKIQRRAVSMVSGLKGVTYEEKLPEVGILTLEERRHQADMVQTFKIVKWIV